MTTTRYRLHNCFAVKWEQKKNIQNHLFHPDMDLNEEKHNKKGKITNFEEKNIGEGPLIGQVKNSHFEKKYLECPNGAPS